MACESVMAILAREGCPELRRLLPGIMPSPSIQILNMILRRCRLLNDPSFANSGKFRVERLSEKLRSEG